MNSRRITVLPRLEKLLAQLGENLKLGRLRRKLTTQQVAAQVLFVLGMEKDLLKLATDDELGRRLQDAQLVTAKRAPKKK